MTETDPWVDIPEAAQQLGVEPITIRRWLGLRDQKAPVMAHSRTPGGRIRIRQSEIDRLKTEYAS